MMRLAILHGGAALVAVGALAALAPWATAQSGGAAVSRRGMQASGGPNGSADRDQAAGAALDSLLDPIVEGGRYSGAATRALGGKPSKATVRPQWTARLARNPNPGDGNPPYVLIDRYGGIQRYVETTTGVDLDRHLGQTVSVRRDTGHTLLASQLELPRAARPAGTVIGDDKGVTLAAMEEPLPAAVPTPADAEEITADPVPDPQEMVEGEGPMFDAAGNQMAIPEGSDPLYLDDGLNFEGCETCGSKVCQMQGGCGFGSRPIFYARMEYLLWWADGMAIPPLVVRGEADGGDFVNAFVVYGNEDILDEARSGGRLRLGYWLDDYGQQAIEAEYFGFGEINTQFVDGGDGASPIVGRPFIDATTGLNAVEDVSFPGIMGTVAVNGSSQFQSAAIALRRNLCCATGQTCCGDAVSCGSQVGYGPMGCGSGVNTPPCLNLFNKGTRHTDVLFGFRWAQLESGLDVTENLTVIAPSPGVGTTFLVNDNFSTSNDFFGGELGFLWDWQYRRWSLEFLSKLAIGSTRQRVSINGSTIRTEPGELPEYGVGGLLAQESNIGNYERNELSVLPQLGVTLGFNLTDRLKVIGGYNFLYWSRVVRPGDQIDLEVNPGNLPFANPPDPDGLPARPQFVYRDTDFWAHGLSAGLEYSW